MPFSLRFDGTGIPDFIKRAAAEIIDALEPACPAISRTPIKAQDMVHCLVHHGVAGDEAALPAFPDLKLLARPRPVGAVHHVALDLSRPEQVVHLEELCPVLERAAPHGLAASVINCVCIVKSIHML